MTHVLLVWSVHRETDFVKAAELHWLLQKLRPDVLFLEHSAKDISTFLDGSCCTLESTAVRRYRTVHPVELVPVDVPLPDADFEQKVAAPLFDRVVAASAEFRRLTIENSYNTDREGFAFLNSPNGVEFQSAIQRVMRRTVEDLADPSLTELYKLWTSTHDSREDTMLDGVEAFARQTPVEKGALILGAAHAPSLFNKLQARRTRGSSAVLWDLDWRQRLENPYGNGVT